MVHGKNQHYVPQFYFRNFSKNGKTICLFNLAKEIFFESTSIKNQCAEDYFYSKNKEVEKLFSNIEDVSSKLISEIINKGSLSFLNEDKLHTINAYILFQHGRTQYSREAEEETANALFEIYKPILQKCAKKKGIEITEECLREVKVKSNLKTSISTSLMSAPLLYDLKVVLLENKTRTDFIFSDSPVVLFNSYFNDKFPYGVEGIASTGLQIYFPLNSKLSLFFFDPVFYELGKKEVIRISKESDIQRLNGLQILRCNKNVYFEDIKMKEFILSRYKQIKSKRSNEKTTNAVVASRIAEDGTYRELWQTSSKKIKYSLEKISFLKHKKTEAVYGVRNPTLVELNSKIINAMESGKIKSQEELKKFLDSFKQR